MGLLFVAVPESPAQPWDVEMLQISAAPTAPQEGEPFHVILEMAYNGCQPTVESVDVDGSLVSIEGLAGAPVDGGCGGVVVPHFMLPVALGGLGAGAYRVEVTFRRLRDGGVADSLQGTVRVRGVSEVPVLTPVGIVPLLGITAWWGVRRLAA